MCNNEKIVPETEKPVNPPVPRLLIVKLLTPEGASYYDGSKWVIGEWRETSGKGELCGGGFLHFYEGEYAPYLALLMNPAHANITRPRMFVAEGDGVYKTDGLKCGYSRGRVVEEMPLPQITARQKRKFAYLCADWACRTLLPQVCDAAGLTDHATTLRALQPITSAKSAARAEAAARAASWAAEAAARAAAWAAEAAAWAAAWAAEAAEAAEAAQSASWAAAWAGVVVDFPAELHRILQTMFGQEVQG